MILRRCSLLFTKCLSRNIYAPLAPISTSSVDWAGSSHWHNIKHTKAAIDSKKGLLVSRCIREIRQALKVGGTSNPLVNDKLARALNRAKASAVKQETIDRSIKAFEQKAQNSSVHLLDMKGPEGSLFIIQVFTDKIGPFRSVLRRPMKKSGLVMTDTGIRAYFNEIGVVTVTNFTPEELAEGEKANIDNLEDAETIAIEVEAEDVHKIERDDLVQYEFICGPRDLSKVSKALSGRNFGVQGSEKEFRAITPISLTPGAQELVQTFYEVVENEEDVERIYDNIAAPSEN